MILALKFQDQLPSRIFSRQTITEIERIRATAPAQSDHFSTRNFLDELFAQLDFPWVSGSEQNAFAVQRFDYCLADFGVIVS
jgi:hypothetical protein